MNSQIENITERIRDNLINLGWDIKKQPHRKSKTVLFRIRNKPNITGLNWIEVGYQDAPSLKGFYVLVGINPLSEKTISRFQCYGFEYYHAGRNQIGGDIWHYKKLFSDNILSIPEGKRNEIIKEILTNLKAELENIVQEKQKEKALFIPSKKFAITNKKAKQKQVKRLSKK